MEFYIAQGISIITTIIAVTRLQAKNMKGMLVGHITTNVLAGSTYFLLNSFSGAGISFIAIAQSIAMYIFNRKNIPPPKWLIGFFLMLYIGTSALSFKTIFDLFPAIAALCFAVSISVQKPLISRLWFIFNPALWVIYDFYAKAYVNAVMHFIILLSTIVALVRVDKIFAKKV